MMRAVVLGALSSKSLRIMSPEKAASLLPEEVWETEILRLRLEEGEMVGVMLALVLVAVKVSASAASASKPSSGICSGAPERRVTLGRATRVGLAKRVRGSSSGRSMKGLLGRR